MGDTQSCKNKGRLDSREMGRETEPRVISALGRSGDKPKVPPVGMLGSPKLPGLNTWPAPDFWLRQGVEQDPLDELGTTKPREPGPLLAPQMAGGG